MAMINIRLAKFLLRTAKTFVAYIYDLYRFLRYSGLNENLKNHFIRNYTVAKTYHALEKSLSFRKRKANSGWSQVRSLIDYHKIALKDDALGFHDRASIKVVESFLANSDPSIKEDDCADVEVFLKEALLENELDDTLHGARYIEPNELISAKLKKPEQFFLTRSSIRSFLNKKVDILAIERAVLFAMKTPTACNRQPWIIYHSSDEVVMKKALSLQSGNRGFGQEIPHLAVIAVDLRAYCSAEERNAHLVDGAMFASTLVYAFHALGVGSCCLNWSRMPSDDIALRESLNINPHYEIIMMIGFGYPDPEAKVCKSARKDASMVLLNLEEKSGG